MVRTKLNRIDTRTTTTDTRASTCHVGNDAFHPRSGIFSPDLSSPVGDNAGRLASNAILYISISDAVTPIVFASAVEKSIAGFRDAIVSLTSSSLFARHVVVSHGGIVMQSSFEDVPRGSSSMEKVVRLVPLSKIERRKEERTELRAIHASVTFYTARSSLQ